MKAKTVTLIRLSLSLSKGGLIERRREVTARDTGLTYTIDLDEPGSGGVRSRRIKKSDIMVSSSGLGDDRYTHIFRLIWCLPDQEQEAKEKLMEVVLKIAKFVKTESEAMLIHVLDKIEQ